MTPFYAIIFMSCLEQEILSSSLLKPLIWWRYIDDIFMICEPGEEELQKFLDALSCYNPTIKFAAEYFREKNKFWMLLYEKGLPNCY